MNKNARKESRKMKKPYAKPEARKVELKAEEAVLGACKMTGHSGPGSATCQIPSNCSSVGS